MPSKRWPKSSASSSLCSLKMLNCFLTSSLSLFSSSWFYDIQHYYYSSNYQLHHTHSSIAFCLHLYTMRTSMRSCSPILINSLRRCNRKSRSSGHVTRALISWRQAACIWTSVWLKPWLSPSMIGWKRSSFRNSPHTVIPSRAFSCLHATQ